MTNRFLISVAALALIAGTGAAGAQEKGAHESGGAAVQSAPASAGGGAAAGAGDSARGAAAGAERSSTLVELPVGRLPNTNATPTHF